MILDLDSPKLGPHIQRLAPHTTRMLVRAAERALRINADVLALEHLIGAFMEDEDCAANQAVCHAFADPETIDVELLALSPGTMVVGSGAALPFSPLSLTSLQQARDAALAARAGVLGVEYMLAHCVDALPDEVRDDLASAGYKPPAVPTTFGDLLLADGHLFQGLSDTAKLSLSRACKAAARAKEASIGPARIVLGLLEGPAALEQAAGLTRSHAMAVLRGRTVDTTPTPKRTLEPDAGLVSFLAALPDGAGTLTCLAACHAAEREELRALLERHKITPALLERAQAAFEDPV